MLPTLLAHSPSPQVKVSYEIEQHVKEAMEEARRAGGTDDEIRQAGERAAQVNGGGGVKKKQAGMSED